MILVACWRQLDENGDALRAITCRKLLHCRRNESSSVPHSYRNYAFLFPSRTRRSSREATSDVGVFRTGRRYIITDARNVRNIPPLLIRYERSRTVITSPKSRYDHSTRTARFVVANDASVLCRPGVIRKDGQTKMVWRAVYIYQDQRFKGQDEFLGENVAGGPRRTRMSTED